jgi:23S rRNA (guanosine2251-2'-O)-methyltransferase
MIKIYGRNSLYEAIRYKAPIKNIILSDTVLKKDNKIIELIKDNGYKYEIKPNSFFNNEKNSQGYIAYREDYKTYNIEDLTSFKKDLGRVVILDGVVDPHNYGAILRSAECFGYDLVILPNNRSCPLSETVVHVSEGAVEHIKIMYVNSLQNALKILKDIGYWIVSTDMNGTSRFSDIKKDTSLAIVIGNEGKGISKTVRNESDYILQIPMKGHVNSLNASVSCGIVLYELMN